MRYHFTTGLTHDQLLELTTRTSHILKNDWNIGTRMSLGLPANRAGPHDPPAEPRPDRRRGIVRREPAHRVPDLAVPAPVPEQVTCLHRSGELEDLARGRIVLVDGTLVPTRCFAPPWASNSSGKHRAHGVNVQVAATESGCLLAVSAPVPGRRHDRRALAEVGWEDALAGACWIADPAYQGTSALTPKKQRPGRSLSSEQVENNAILSTARSGIERAIAHLKNWKILATGYRGRLRESPVVIRVGSAIEFYRLGW